MENRKFQILKYYTEIISFRENLHHPPTQGYTRTTFVSYPKKFCVCIILCYFVYYTDYSCHYFFLLQPLTFSFHFQDITIQKFQISVNCRTHILIRFNRKMMIHQKAFLLGTLHKGHVTKDASNLNLE